MHTYEEVVRATATKEATWYVVPADHKWFTRLAVAAAILEAVENLDLTYPTGAEEGARRGTRRTRGREMSRLAPAEKG